MKSPFKLTIFRRLLDLLLNVPKAIGLAFLWLLFELLFLDKRAKRLLAVIAILLVSLLIAFWVSRYYQPSPTTSVVNQQPVAETPAPSRPEMEIDPPFGFRWGDSQARVEAVLNYSYAPIISRNVNGDLETWIVEGLIHPGLKRTKFVFQKNSLRDVELQCQYDSWPFERYQAKLEELRAYFDAKYQEGPLSTALLSNVQPGAAESRIGYGWKFSNSNLAAFCRSFMSLPPEELSASDIIVRYARHDSNFETELAEVPENRWTAEVMSPVVAQKLRSETDGVPTESALGISESKLLNASHLSQTLLTLQLAIKLRQNTPIDPTKALVQVYFYDTIGNKEVVLTDADVNYQWRSRRDWKEANPETLTVTYLRTRDKIQLSAARKYFGYVAVVYYDDKLQSVRAEPVKLLNLFPPRIFISLFENAQRAVARGDYTSAAQLYQKAADQGNLWACENLAWFYAQGKGVPQDYRKAAALYEKGALQTSARAFNALAWFIATCPDDSIRNGNEAVRHALKGCELTYWQERGHIDTLAAAYAETGNFDRAINYQKHAMQMKGVDAETRRKMEERLALYQQHQPYRELVPAAESPSSFR